MRKSNNHPVRFGFLTDTHFSVIRKNFRTDDYFESVLSKFRECYRHFQESGCQFVLHGGDMFDKYCSYSHRMILGIRDVIMSSPVPTYVIWGQHDLLGYNRESGRNSNLSFLITICDGKLVEIKDMIELDGARVFASHVDQVPSDVLSSISPRYRKPSVCVVHALLYDQPSRFDTIDIRSLPRNGACLVLSGDLHCGYGRFEHEGTVYYNPGSLARTSREDRKPKCAVIELTPFMNRWDVTIEEYFPFCQDHPFPEEKEEVEKPEEMDSSDYIESFEKFKSESKDIFERLEKVGNEHGIDREILEYIKSKQGVK